MNYIANPKNRKLKSRLLHLTSRIKFVLDHLGWRERSTLALIGVLIVSLFLPWFRVVFSNQTEQYYYLTSGYTGIGLWVVLLSIVGSLFFLFSHKRKEWLRPYFLGGIMDGQIMMLLGIFLSIELLDIHAFSTLYQQYATEIQPQVLSGYILAFVASIGLIITGYLLLQKERREIHHLAFIDRSHGTMAGGSMNRESPEASEDESRPHGDSKRNMTLPI